MQSAVPIMVLHFALVTNTIVRMNISPLIIPLLDDNDRKKALFLAIPELYIDEWFFEIENARRFPAKRLAVLDEYIQLISRSSFAFDEEELQSKFVSFEARFSHLRDFMENNFLTKGDTVALSDQDDSQYDKTLNALENLLADTMTEYKLLVSYFTKGKKHNVSTALHYSTYDSKFVWNGTKSYNISGKKQQQMYRVLWNHRCKQNKLSSAQRVGGAELVTILGLSNSPERLISILKDSRTYLRRKGVPVKIDGNMKKGFVLVTTEMKV